MLTCTNFVVNFLVILQARKANRFLLDILERPPDGKDREYPVVRGQKATELYRYFIRGRRCDGTVSSNLLNTHTAPTIIYGIVLAARTVRSIFVVTLFACPEVGCPRW